MTVGLSAYTTFNAMNLHFRKGSYDGWKYNFKTHVNADNFQSNKTSLFQFAAIERTHTKLLEQIKYFYPAFAAFGYISSKNLRVVRLEYLSFMKKIDSIEETFASELEKVSKNMENILDLLDNSGTMPEIFNLYDTKQLSYSSIVILFMIIPELNKIVSREPFVFDDWKTQISFDMKFYGLYIAPTQRSKFKQITISTFNNIQ